MKILSLSIVLASSLVFSNAMAHDKGKMQTFHVTITNTTANHVITPPTVIAYKKGFMLFKVTHPASEELAMTAESGNNGPLMKSLKDNKDVYAVMSTLDQDPPVIKPGQSITVTIKAPRWSFFTVAGMLATTNDAFTAVTLRAPKVHGYANGMGMTYDAGSEENNELCIDIPGPPCGGANAPTTGGEGFVTIHNGVHGVADLMPAKLDWRGPTSMVKIHNGG